MRALALALLATCVLTTTALALPFLRAARVSWEEGSAPFLGGTLALLAGAWVHARLGRRLRAVAAFSVWVFGASWIVEAVGRSTGFPFGGTWTYDPALRPVLPGGVPLAIPLAWTVLAYAPWFLLRGLTGRRAGRLWVATASGALFLAGVDLLLEPLAVGAGAWAWDGGGAYFGAPVANAAGWCLVGALLLAPVLALDARGARRSLPADRLLAGGGVLLLALASAAALVRVGSGVPVLLCALATAPTWVLGARSMRSPGQ